MINEFKVITLCGSTRFKEQFLEVQKRLTLEGNVVISVGLFGHSGDEEVWKPGIKDMLDRMHLSKIDMADEIFVINVDGYIGESTQREISYALSHGKIVKYLETPHDMMTETQQPNLKRDIVEHWETEEEKNRNTEIELYHAKKAIEYLKEILDSYKTNYIEEFMRTHDEDYYLYQLFGCRIGDLSLSTRTQNVLSHNNIETIGDLVRQSARNIKKLHGLGKLCFNEISDLLESLSLDFGYDVDSREKAYHLYYTELREQIRHLIPILNIKIENTPLVNKYYYNRLITENNIKTLGDLASLHKKGLSLSYFYDREIEEIESLLRSYGLYFGLDVRLIYEEFESMKQHGYNQD